MQGLNKWLVSICLSVVIVLAQIIVAQYMVVSGLRTELRFAQAAHRLTADQIADLTYQVECARNELNTQNTQQFIAGVVAAIDRRDEYTAIWHDGYSRGSEVQQYAAELDAKKTAAYTSEEKK